MSFSSLISCALEHHVEQQRLELVGQLLRLGRAAAALDHLLPLRQVRIELRRLRQELEPAIEQLVVELLGVDDLRRPLPSARRAPSTPPPCTSTPAAPASRRAASTRCCVNSSSSFSFFSICLSCCVVLVDDALRGQRIFVIRRVQEDAGQRVVVLGRNRIVLVIVAAGAADGQAEEAARHDVDAIVALVGAGDLDRAVVVEPRARGRGSRAPAASARASPRRPSRSPASCALTNWSYGRSSLNALITQSRYR